MHAGTQLKTYQNYFEQVIIIILTFGHFQIFKFFFILFRGIINFKIFKWVLIFKNIQRS